MEIYPAIDLMNGRCVRLTEGDFNARQDYNVSPLEVARSYEETGAKWIHLVDLDGARDATTRQTALIGDIVKVTRLNVQTGGGVRSVDDAKRLLDRGAVRVIIGSLAVKNPDATHKIIQKCGADRIVLALDVRGDFAGGFYVATAGWQETSCVRIEELLTRYNGHVRHVLCTDISKDGQLNGVNAELYRDLVRRFPAIQFQASGGVATLDDIDAIETTGVAGVVIGKALYENRFTLREALERTATC